MASLIARATAFAIRLAGIRKYFADENALADHIRRTRRGPARPSALMKRRFGISSQTRHGYEVYAVAPRAGRSAGNVIYIHGGAYVYDIRWWHWRFIAGMVDRLGMTFTVPLYPLAPEHDCAAVSAFVLAVYRDLLAGQDPSQPVIMGESAGGGFAVSLTKQATSVGFSKPAALVLMSPWLDVTMSDPAQEQIEKVDPVLMRPGAKAAGRWYAGSMPTTDPRVSPIYGEIAGLPPALMFCGTCDILVTDARRLAARAAVEGADVEYHEEAGLMHAYPLLFFPESRKAQDRIVHYVRDAIHKSRPARGRVAGDPCVC
jgi:monoterpene epsilon-lactone hydrolase